MAEFKLDYREKKDLELAFEYANQVVSKNYLSDLSSLNMLFTKSPDRDSLIKSISLLKLSKIVYNNNENNIQKLVNVFGVASAIRNDLVLIIHSDGNVVEYYYGVVGANRTSTARANAVTLQKTIEGNFCGTEIEQLNNSDLMDVLEKITNKNYQYVSSVSAVGSSRSEEDIDNKSFCQGIEKVLDSVSGRPFSAVFIAKYIAPSIVQDLRAEEENLYSRLYPFSKSELNFNESSSDGITKTLTNSLSTTISKNKSTALSLAETKNNSHTEGKSVTHNDTGSVSAFTAVSAGVPGVGSASAGKSIGYSHSVARGENWSDTVSFGTTESQTKTIGSSESEGEIKSIADGTTKQNTTGRSLQISSMNKSVTELLEQIDEHLERIKEGSNYGMFAVAGYFLSEDSVTTNIAASSYKGIISGSKTHIENAEINTWYDTDNVNCIKNYLRQLTHPLFAVDGINTVSAATLVSGKELAIQMGFPFKSIPGIDVIEIAPFGRNINQNQSGNRTLELGNLFHMGRDEGFNKFKVPVKLNLDSLTAHTFVTGSTGSGKSNTVYHILDAILKQYNTYNDKITFLVVEPAKGEYKYHFGKNSSISVYGTNYKKTPLLRINPFSFPEDILVLEHIDKLIEIFNVCWPMYAAMPAVLKDSVERAYIKAGWNLDTSECKYKKEYGMNIYPCFEDVLEQVNVVMEESKYSSDSKGDYTGALCTRLKSLTNGLYRQIFSSDELSNQELFDRNVIVDLSRVGSSETKSLLMGLLVMKLQEYRMSEANGANSKLKHLTVLEEAHNLLKRTSTEQSMEGSNLLGKSVEMLSNSIAEMRTYGEGFIIVDQAPGLLDMSAIRNTNTKIIMRLPDFSDRELVGRAAALNDKQIIELSKLGTGIAAVYQNNWLEAVLCHIHSANYNNEGYSFDYQGSGKKLSVDFKDVISYILLPVKKKLEIGKEHLDRLTKIVLKTDLPSGQKADILDYFKCNSEISIKKIRPALLYDMFNSKDVFSKADKFKGDIVSWRDFVTGELLPDISEFDKSEKDKILTMLAVENFENNKIDSNRILLDNLVDYIRGGLK